MAALRYLPLTPLVTLDSQINQPPNSETYWSEIINRSWGTNFTPTSFQTKRPRFECFTNYYARQGRSALEDGGRHILSRTHKDILEIIEQLISGKGRAEIWQELEQKPPSPRPNNAEELIDNSIDLAARLLLMIQVGDPSHFALERCEELVWEEGSIAQFTDEYFKPQVMLATDKTRLDSLFNARNLDRMAGLKIFVQKLFPASFIDETVRTISLLLPRNNTDVAKWYRGQKTIEPLDLTAIDLPYLKTKDRRIENFAFWRDRLIILKQRFDEAEPGSFRQWRYDKRRRAQFYTFWIAVFGLVVTAFSSVIQSVEGAVQIYKAFHPN